jgi:hypothetical protein
VSGNLSEDDSDDSFFSQRWVIMLLAVYTGIKPLYILLDVMRSSVTNCVQHGLAHLHSACVFNIAGETCFHEVSHRDV